MNGWENNETWLASLWIQNDEGLYHEAKAAARRGKLREFITEFLLNAVTLGEGSSGFAVDMMSAAIVRLDWDELQGLFEEESDD